jgi:hypothetical protein
MKDSGEHNPVMWASKGSTTIVEQISNITHDPDE